MPFDDWQFWIVTIIGLVGLWKILRTVLPSKNKTGCSHCASGSAAATKKRPTKVSLTVDNKRV